MGTCRLLQFCDQLTIPSQNNLEKLAEAKERVYLEGFNEGVSPNGYT
jgi:hypothetical protein